jgi:hypothetical protein
LEKFSYENTSTGDVISACEKVREQLQVKNFSNDSSICWDAGDVVTLLLYIIDTEI